MSIFEQILMDARDTHKLFAHSSFNGL